VSTTVRVGNHAVDQLDPSGNHRILASYFFRDITGLYEVPDYPGGFVIEVAPYGRLHLFAAEARSEILGRILEHASQFIGVTLPKPKSMTFDRFIELKFGTYRSDVHITSISEFLVYKQSHRHEDPVRRSLCLTETCLLERDPATYSIVSLRPLSQVCAFVRHSDHPQLVSVQYANGEMRSYTSTDRDSLIASFLDGVRGSGNRDVHVRMSLIERDKRLAPLNVPVDEDVESSHLKFIVQPPPSWSFSEAVARFNANIAYSGLVHAVTQEHLFAENKEKLINGALMALITKDISNEDVQGLEQQFHALRRLVASKAGFAGFTSLPGFREKIGVKVAKALKLGHDGISHAAIDMVCALMEPMHEDYDLRQEQLNKSSLLSSERFLDGLLDMWTTHVVIISSYF
jgi:DnaJ family protein C protein 13